MEEVLLESPKELGAQASLAHFEFSSRRVCKLQGSLTLGSCKGDLVIACNVYKLIGIVTDFAITCQILVILPIFHIEIVSVTVYPIVKQSRTSSSNAKHHFILDLTSQPPRISSNFLYLNA